MKRFFLRALLGMLVGIAVRYIVAIIISLKLRLGYLMAYIAAFSESVHGEMRAVLWETALSGFLGMGTALAITFAQQKKWPFHRRCLAAGASLLAGCLPVALVALHFLYELV